ncbi:hypothetical protein KHQ89_07055 [Mycoplasmatota bacterium]|nr:hypothetical protein KHQ89_07055 [Mycoplasmatota bacterium]
MNEKDPFSEYDNFWDDLDQIESEVKEKEEKVYRFHEQSETYQKRQNISRKDIGKILSSIMFVLIILNIFTDVFAFLGIPSFLFIIVIGIIISAVKGDKRG